MPVGTLPKEATTLYEKVYKDYLHGECNGNEECAAKRAWGAVKVGWKKGEDGKWHKKSEALVEFSFAITKASYDKATGEMRWSAVASDTDEDSYGERMSLELFKDFVKRSESGEKPPQAFCSSFWCGGMPYVSVAHYSDLEGRAVPGEIKKLYIDGNRLKAQGVFFDTPLGNACFRSICNDLYGEKSNGQDKVRISIGFLDWAHRHNNVALFERKTLSDVCPLCAERVGGKQYIRGQLIHLALTRVPVNQRTDIEPVMKSEVEMGLTRKGDAASIIGEELAEEIDQEAKLVGKSEALVEKSDEEVAEEKPVEETPTEVKEDVEPEVAVVEVEAKSDAATAYRPLGGATSWEAAEQFSADQETVAQMYDSWYMLQSMMMNIMDDPESDAKGKKQMMMEAMSGCQKKLQMKALTALEQLSLVQKSDTVSMPPHVLDTAIVQLKADFDRVVQLEGADEAKLHELDAPLTNLVELIRSNIVRKEEPQPEAVPEGVEALRSELMPAIQKLAEQVSLLTTQMSAKSTAQAPAPAATPQRRSITPSLLQQKSVTGQQTEKESSFRRIARRNSGLPY